MVRSDNPVQLPGGVAMCGDYLGISWYIQIHPDPGFPVGMDGNVDDLLTVTMIWPSVVV